MRNISRANYEGQISAFFVVPDLIGNILRIQALPHFACFLSGDVRQSMDVSPVTESIRVETRKQTQSTESFRSLVTVQLRTSLSLGPGVTWRGFAASGWMGGGAGTLALRGGGEQAAAMRRSKRAKRS